MATTRYDRIGRGYARMRREDPRIAARIHAALGSARSVVNVGAGAGSYEPRDRRVIAIEPSVVMAAQRPRELAPVIRARADALPLRDASVDAAMAVLTMHHWDAAQEHGVRELRRVARGPVVVLSCDADVIANLWLNDYLPELGVLEKAIFPRMEQLTEWLDGDTRVETIPIPRDITDWMLISFWAHPERVLDADARNATSGFARMAPHVVDRVVARLTRDLADGSWDARHGHLRELREYDAGLRMLVSEREA